MSTVKILKNKRKIVFAIQLMFMGALIFSSNSILLAMGTPAPDGGTYAGLCYNPDNQKVQVVATESAISGCKNLGYPVINVNEPVPVPVCVAGDKIESIAGPESAKEACRNIGATVIEAGQPLPAVIIPDFVYSPSYENGKMSNFDENKIKTITACKPDKSKGETKINAENCAIWARLSQFINITSASVGIVIISMLAWSGIIYTTSRDNPQQTAKAKSHITYAIIALMLYIFSIAILNWLIPGGVFG